jgi:hypothetical protein
MVMVVPVVRAGLRLRGREVAEAVAVRAHPQVTALVQDHVHNGRHASEHLEVQGQ